MYRGLTAIILAMALTLAGCGGVGQTRSQGGLSVMLETSPSPPLTGRPTMLRLGVERAGTPLDAAQISLTRGMPGMEHPDDNTPLPARALGGGRYEAQTKFVMGGRWDLVVTVIVPNEQQWVVTFQLDVEQP